MENKLTRWVYDRTPPVLQDVFASAYGTQKLLRRYASREYDRWYGFYKQSFHWSRAELDEFQRKELRRIIRHAYETTPFYRDLFDGLKLKPGDIRDVADLPKLPLLEKDVIREQSERMISSKYNPRDLTRAPTGGSTGMPLMIYTARQVLPRAYAFLWARWRRNDVHRGEPYASFTGLQIVKPERTRPPFWRRNLAARQTCYSVFHLSPANMRYYAEDLSGRRFAWWEGYPSAMAVVASYMKSSGVRLPNPPKGVYCSSEECQPIHRETIERALKTRVWDCYGQGEKAGSINEYPCGHYHYDMDYSILEFLPIGEDGGEKVYEVISTGFINDSWPMIRYRVGDMVTFDDEASCDVCHMPIIKRVQGRTGQVIRTPDGRTITNISVITKKCHRVKAIQVVQERLDRITIRVIPAPGYTKEDEAYLRQQFEAKYGQTLGMDIEYLDALERTRLGKVLSIISRL